MVKTLTYFSLCILLLAGCVMGEMPIDPPAPGEVNTLQVETGNDYGTQVFYNIRDQYVAGTIDKTAWDIGLMWQHNQWIIRLNTALGGGAARVEDDFQQVTNPAGLSFAIDASSGNPDSVAIGIDQAVYVIDRGFDPEGNALGHHKLQILDTLTNGVQIRLAAMDNQRDTTISLIHDTTRHITPLSFTDYTSAALPHKEDWDLLFAQYMFQFTNPPIAYLVTGVLLNPEGYSAALVTQRNFEAITLDDVANYSFSSDWDAIGYNWKAYNYDEGLYEVDSSQIYIVKTKEGRYFKLQFLDFYAPTGEKGAPLFNCQPL